MSDQLLTSTPEDNKNEILLQFPILMKPFVSFSAGSFIAIDKFMVNKTFDWQPVPNTSNIVTDTSKYRLIESGYSSPLMGFSALANFQWKTSRSFGFGGSVGVGLTIEKSPRPSYLVGGSLFFGDLRQLVITGGLGITQVDHLQNNLQAVVDQQIAYSSKQVISYYKDLRTGWFISFTYTPFKTSKIRK